MSPQAQLVLLIWPILIIFLFNKFSAQKAVIFAFVGAWLFLPQRAGFILPGLPDYERMSATCYSIFLATLVFNYSKFRQYRFSWLDIPIIISSIAPLISSLSNDLGLYNGLSSSLTQTVKYGLPYLLGRICITQISAFRQLAITIFVGGLIYVPLCLYEIRMSPQLHNIVYGYLGNPKFAQTIRLGGYRPTVFMQHGLSVGMWMMAAALTGFWLWRCRVIRKLWNIPVSWLVIMLTITFILVKSTAAYIYFSYGLISLLIAKKTNLKIPFLLLIFGIIFYLFIAATGLLYNGIDDSILSFLSQFFPDTRTDSLQFRFDNEYLLTEKALERPLFGWGGWGRNRIYEYNWEGVLQDVSVTDSLWIISYGINGLLGLISIFAASLLPTLMFVTSKYFHFVGHQKIAPIAVLATVLPLYMVDCLLNNQYNPVFMLISGALVGFLSQTRMNIKKVRK